MASGLFAVMAAPYLPRLVMEGFPRAKWPAPGSFAALDGEKQALPVGPVGSLNDWSEELFTGSDGRALLIYRKGTVELAHYADDVRPEIRLNSYSMVKSLVGALLLKAIAEGRISSLDDPVGQYLPDVGDAVFRAVPLHAFATMRSGVGAETGVGDPVSPQESRSVDRIASGLFSPIARLHMGGLNAVSGELSSDPDARGTYSYQNVNTAVISGVLSAVYGKPLETILNEKIWAPSGAGKAEWRRYHSDLGVTAYCCIYATPSDWLRVGVFLMKNGDQDRPFLPHTLWQTYFGGSISKQARHAGRYGMHVFHNVLDRKGQPLQGPFSFMAGTGGQRVYMMPEADLVVVRFGAKRQLLHSTLYAAWQLIEE
ncbi:MAG: serine hydrolase [Stappiaceae bacterium]